MHSHCVANWTRNEHANGVEDNLHGAELLNLCTMKRDRSCMAHAVLFAFQNAAPAVQLQTGFTKCLDSGLCSFMLYKCIQSWITEYPHNMEAVDAHLPCYKVPSAAATAAEHPFSVQPERTKQH